MIEPDGQGAFEFVRENIAQTPYHQWLGPVLTAVDGATGAVTIELALRPEFWRLPGRAEAHGGIVATLIDIAGHAAIAARLRHGVATVDMRVDFLRLALGPKLTATASIVKLGRTLALVDIRVADDEARIVAVGRTSYLCAYV